MSASREAGLRGLEVGAMGVGQGVLYADLAYQSQAHMEDLRRSEIELKTQIQNASRVRSTHGLLVFVWSSLLVGMLLLCSTPD